jgi:hypothetical protein
MYSTSDLTFLPTVSPDFIRDAHSTKQYFAEFIKRLPEGKITDEHVQSISDDAYLHSGMYTFMTGPEDDRQPVLARFTYMWRMFNGKYKIVHHHSSVVPGTGAAPKKEEEVIDLAEVLAIARQNFDRWNKSLKAKDYEQVTSCACLCAETSSLFHSVCALSLFRQILPWAT